ncbi:MAG: CDC48 family AAA ATPase [Candidatus Heimdallarchaeota archaeon]|nr:MAG: CDC48 family AAA ATPase [Candidatus Heimdallarchaeota archaeon]
MTDDNEKDLLLKVVEANQGDVGRGLVRVDYSIMRENGLETGDIVEIASERAGGKKTGALVIPGRREDRGKNIIRMDGLIRGNVGTSLGETVRIRKIKKREAKRITIAPAEERIRLLVRSEIIRERLQNHPVSRGDLLVITGQIRKIPPSGGGTTGTGMDDFISRFFGATSPVSLGEIKVVVVATDPDGIVTVGDTTEVKIVEEAPKDLRMMPRVTYEDIGGLSEEIKRVREMIELPMKHPQLFERLGIDPPKGVLLHGPPGTGKTLLAKAVANESGVNFVSIAGPEIMSKFYGESEQRIREIFQNAEKEAPSIIFIDELDSIAVKREEVTGEVERRVVAQLLALMDGLKSRGKVIVIGATNRPNALDPALRRPGRFDREIEIGVPDKNGRYEVLLVHTRGMPLADDVDLNEYAAKTHGFVGADIAALTKEAAMHTLRKVLPRIDFDKPLTPEILSKLVVSKENFDEALKITEPSAMREVLLEIPNIHWDDIGGLETVKQQLIEAVEWPIVHPEIFQRHGVTPPHGILLYGPPGTGKTLLAKAVATESQANFIAIRGPELLSKWVGESEKAVREVFRKAKQASPSIIFLDELDAIAPRRGAFAGGSHVTESVVNQILSLLDGLESLRDVMVLGASNRPDMIDPALLRPGRFDRLLLVKPPDMESRKKILKIHTNGMKLGTDVDLSQLASDLEGYVGADIAAICREAVMIALREDLNADLIELRHFHEAKKAVHPSINDRIIKEFIELERKLLGKSEIGKKDILGLKDYL